MKVDRSILDGMHELQEEMQQFIKELSNGNPELSYDACFTIYMLNKVSHLQQQIDDIKTFLVI